jgi:hypothetical protein
MATLSVSQFGAYRFNEAVRFDEAASYSVSPATYLEGRFGMGVYVYEGGICLKKAALTSEQAENPVQSAEFEFVEGGCANFTIKLNENPADLGIREKDRVDIHLMSTVRPWFSGIVQEMPCVNTERREYVIKGHGYRNVFEDIIVESSYTQKDVGYIVKDLVNTYLLTRDVILFPDQIMSSGYTVQSVKFDRVTLAKALKTLTELLQHHVFGVDEERMFFFRPQGGKPIARYSDKASHWVGYNLQSFELKEKTKGISNTLHVKIGTISEENSNFASFTVTSLDSIAFFGERTKVVSAPELKSEDDALCWADNELEKKAWAPITATAKSLKMDWVTSRDDLLRAEGFMRVSLPRSGLAVPYYEPLNGYYRYEDLGSSDVHGLNWIKRAFTARKGGDLGRIQLMVQKVGSPGNLTVRVKKGTTTLETVNVAQGDIPEWFDWIDFAIEKDTIYKGLEYTVEIYASSGDSSNYYRVLYSSHDATFSGGFYSSSNGGSDWNEDTGKGIIFRSYLIHDDEFVLALKKVKYKATPQGGIEADIDLGEIEQPLPDRILSILRELKAEELLQQSNVEELAA